MNIPKITHQIWMQGFENIPDKFKKNLETLHRLNPEYEHKQWDESMLRDECKKYSEECLERFNSLEQMILKVDLGRYVVLYNYGGISVDTDMEQLKPIRTLPDIDSNKFMISKSAFPYNMVGILNNAIIITPVNNKILETIIEAIINDKRKASDFSTKELCTQYLTGPKFISDILTNISMPYTIINNKYFEPCSSNDIFCTVDKDAIMDHKHDGSWVSSYINILLKILIFIIRFFIYIVLAIILIYFIIFRRGGKKKSKRV
jgi:mannosyltransferase OCH1-like enzyme